MLNSDLEVHIFHVVFIPAIMRFMGDVPLKGQTEQDLVNIILKVLTHSSHKKDR